MQFVLDLTLYCILGGALFILLLVLCSFIINARHIGRVEERCQALEKARDELGLSCDTLSRERTELKRELEFSNRRLEQSERQLRQVSHTLDECIDELSALRGKLRELADAQAEAVAPEPVPQTAPLPPVTPVPAALKGAQPPQDAEPVNSAVMSGTAASAERVTAEREMEPDTVTLSTAVPEAEPVPEHSSASETESAVHSQVAEQGAALSAEGTEEVVAASVKGSVTDERVLKARRLMEAGASFKSILADTGISGEELEMMFAVAGLSAHPEDLQKVSLASQAQASMAESHFAPVPEESSVAPVSEERASPAHAPALPDELLRERQAAARRVVEQLSAAQGREMSEEPSVSEEERSLQERLNVAMREYEESTGSSRPVSPASSVATATPKVASFAARGAYGITSSPGVKSLRARHRR